MKNDDIETRKIFHPVYENIQINQSFFVRSFYQGCSAGSRRFACGPSPWTTSCTTRGPACQIEHQSFDWVPFGNRTQSNLIKFCQLNKIELVRFTERSIIELKQTFTTEGSNKKTQSNVPLASKIEFDGVRWFDLRSILFACSIIPKSNSQ